MASGSPFQPHEVSDSLFTLQDGVNSGISPLLISHTQLASGTNVTTRGTLLQPRPPFQLIEIEFSGSPSPSQSAFQTGNFQGGCYFKPDNGFESLIFQIGGRLFQITPGANTASFLDVTVPGNTVGGAGPNPTSPQQAWLWQSEKWVIVNDGVSTPIFFDQTANPTSRRSTWNTSIPQNSKINMPGGFVVPAVGATPVITPTIISGAPNTFPTVIQGSTVTIQGFGTWLVQAINSTTSATLVNLTGPVGKTVPNGTVISWFVTSTELPPGGMGAYGTQNWFALPDFKQFTASDQVGDSSGTQANNYRDSVLNISRNQYLAGGGNFTVPGTAGELTAFCFLSVLDNSLGQGPLQVCTPDFVYSVNVSTNPLQWQNQTNPLLAPSQISYGGLGQWSTTVANSDLLMRSADGSRSLQLSRRDYNTWGQTPISREVDPILSADPPSLLRFASRITFDNRDLLTASPTVGPQGVYWKQIVALNFDPVSSLRGKAQSVYDGSWIGLNVYQLIKGRFSGVERAFALCYNAITKNNELYEIYKTILLPAPKPLQQNQGYFDNGTERIVSAFQTSAMLLEVPGKTKFDLCRLIDGEISLDNVQQTTDVQVWYRPDSYPCWIPWTRFQICAPVTTDDPLSQPGYRTRIGLGEPSGKLCEPGNNRPFRTGYFFQFRFVMTGPWRLIDFKVKAVTEPQSQFAKPAGCCLNDTAIPFPANAKPQPIIPVQGEVFGVPSTGEVFGDSSGDVFGVP